MKVLFIGNSYTYYNSIWDRFLGLAQASGHAVEVDSVTKGGYAFFQMNDPENEYGRIVHEKLATTHYDVIFLQEQSHTPISNHARFETHGEELIEKAKRNGARPILYQTWGRKEGSPDLAMLGLTDAEMTVQLASAYRALGTRLGVEVSPVGDAFFDVAIHHPELELYHADRSHPSPLGTYLAALCHFETVFGISCVGNTYAFGTENPEEIRILQEAAHRAVTNRKAET